MMPELYTQAEDEADTERREREANFRVHLHKICYSKQLRDMLPQYRKVVYCVCCGDLIEGKEHSEEEEEEEANVSWCIDSQHHLCTFQRFVQTWADIHGDYDNILADLYQLILNPPIAFTMTYEYAVRLFIENPNYLLMILQNYNRAIPRNLQDEFDDEFEFMVDDQTDDGLDTYDSDSDTVINSYTELCSRENEHMCNLFQVTLRGNTTWHFLSQDQDQDQDQDQEAQINDGHNYCGHNYYGLDNGYETDAGEYEYIHNYSNHNYPNQPIDMEW